MKQNIYESIPDSDISEFDCTDIANCEIALRWLEGFPIFVDALYVLGILLNSIIMGN